MQIEPVDRAAIESIAIDCVVTRRDRRMIPGRVIVDGFGCEVGTVAGRPLKNGLLPAVMAWAAPDAARKRAPTWKPYFSW
jgi:hypothetical protein